MKIEKGGSDCLSLEHKEEIKVILQAAFLIITTEKEAEDRKR